MIVTFSNARFFLHLVILTATAASTSACFSLLLYGDGGSGEPGVYHRLNDMHGEDAAYESSKVRHSTGRPEMLFAIEDIYSHEELIFTGSRFSYQGPNRRWHLSTRSTTRYPGLMKANDTDAEAIIKGRVTMKPMEHVGDGAWLVLPDAGIAVNTGLAAKIPLYVGPPLPPSAGEEVVRSPDGVIRIGRRAVLRPIPNQGGEYFALYDLFEDGSKVSDAVEAPLIVLRPGDHYLQLRRPHGGESPHFASLYRMPAPAPGEPPSIYLANANLDLMTHVDEIKPGVAALQGLVILVAPVAFVVDIVLMPVYVTYFFVTIDDYLSRCNNL